MENDDDANHPTSTSDVDNTPDFPTLQDPEQPQASEPRQSTAPPSARRPHKPIRILACVLCQHRKIRCDRTQPSCANCAKAGVTCTPSTPAPARKRRRPNQDLQERLAKCEELIKLYAGSAGAAELAISASTSSTFASASQSTATTPTKTPTYSATATDEAPYLHALPAGKVTSGDGQSQFVESHLWANLHNELKAMRTILEQDENQERFQFCATDPVSEDFEALILHGSPSESVDAFQPEPVHIFRLWQMYIDRVNPLSKIIHVPSVQPYMVEAATNPQNIPANIQALLFAIHTMAATSMDEAECRQILSMERGTAIDKFTQGTKAALVKCQFIRSFDTTTVQTLLIHILSLQGRYRRDSLWILHGINIRVAQKLGFHRDGEAQGLSPFEAEMQRRIWWQVVMLDSRLALNTGLSPSHSPTLWDTKLPLNVNDADLFPSSTEPIRPREGPTEMAFCLLSYRMHQCLLQNVVEIMPAFEAILVDQQLGESVDANDQIIKRHKVMAVRIDEALKAFEEKYVDTSAGPVHIMAKLFRPMVMEKVWAMIAPMREQPEWGTEIFCPKDNLFKMSVITAHQTLCYYEIVTELGFIWFLRQHTPFDKFAVLVGQLCKRARGSLVDRAWDVVDKMYHYHHELHDVSQKKYAVVASFTLKAWKTREAALREIGSPVIVPECIALIKDILPAGHGSPSSDGVSLYASRPSTAAAAASAAPMRKPSEVNASSATSPIAGTAPAPSQSPAGPQMDGLATDSGLDQILQDSWGMPGLDWDVWADASLNVPAAQLPVQNPMSFGFGSMSNGLGW